MRKIIIAVLILMAAHGAQADPHPFEPSKYHAPLRMKLEEPLPGKLVRGRYLKLRLVIRNITGEEGSHQAPVAIVLRGVAWSNYRLDERSWLHRVYGDLRGEQDGTWTFDTMSQRLSDVWLESALLFPGEQVSVDMPFTIQHGGRQKVDVAYAVVGGVEKFATEVWLPGESGGRYKTFYRATPDRINARRGIGGEAVVRASSRPSAQPLVLAHEKWSVEIPVVPDVKGVTTGGLSWDGAIAKIGWSDWIKAHPKRNYWGFWSDALSSWIFVRDDGTASALRRERGAWTHDRLPKMDPTVPDFFGTLENRGTGILLRPHVFKDILEVRMPSQKMYYDPGVTQVPADRLWDVILRARDRALELRVVTFDANGLGNQQALSAGIRVDGSGHWLEGPPEKRY